MADPQVSGTSRGRSRPSARQSLDQLAHCLEAELGSESWWQCVADGLAAMSAELAAEDVDGLVAQVLAEVPERARPAERIRRLHDGVRVEVQRLGATVDELAGSPGRAAHDVRAALRAVLAKVQRVYTLTDALLIDAYSLDIGTGD